MNDILFFVRLLKPNRYGWLGALLLSLLTVATGLGLIALSGSFITASALAGIAAPDGVAVAFNFMQPAVQIRLLAMVRTASGYAERLLAHHLTFHYLAELRVWFFRQLLTQNNSLSVGHRSGEILTVMSRHIDALDQLPLRLIVPGLSALLLISASVIGLGMFSWILSVCIALIALLLCLVLPFMLNRLNRDHAAGFSQCYSQYKALQTQMLQGVQDLCVFQAYDGFANRLNQLAQQLAHDRSRSQLLNAGGAAFNGLIVQAGVILVAIAGSVWVGHENMDAAVYVMLVLLVLSLSEWLSGIGQGLGAFAEAQTAATAIRSFVPSDSVGVSEPQLQIPPEQGVIELQNLHFSYPGRLPVFDGIDLNIQPKEKIALLGGNGEGKTTLLHLICGLLDGHPGQIIYDGKALNAYHRNTYIQRFGLLSQHSKIFTGTVWDNLKLAKPEADESELYPVLQQVGLESLANTGQGLNRWLGEGCLQLSTGEARRLALARVLLKNPAILLLDEPTENLDRHTEQKLLSVIDEWAQDKTVILVTHKPEALVLVNRVYQLQGGKLEFV